MKKKQFKIAPTVAGVLILSLLLTYFLMSGTTKTINDASEQEPYPIPQWRMKPGNCFISGFTD